MRKIIIFLLTLSSLTFVSCSKDEDTTQNQTTNQNNNTTTYTVRVNTNDASMGIVTVSPNTGSYTAGTQVTITAVPNDGYKFVRWDDDTAGTTNPYTFTVSTDVAFTAFFSTTSQPYSPADDFVGDYALDGTLTINLPDALGGTQTRPIENIEISIIRNGDNGDVTIIMGDESYDGYVNNSGLHIDPIIVNYPLGQYNIALTATIPTINKPVNGVTTCQATIMASVYGITITGNADVTATKIE